MLPLLERVVEHLQRVRRIAGKMIVDRDEHFDHGRFEAFVVEAFERATRDGPDAARLESGHWRWEREYLRCFVDELHWLLLDGIGAQWPSSQRARFIEAAILRASSLPEDEGVATLTAPREHLLGSLLRSVQQSIGHSMQEWPERAPWHSATRYCQHLGLTRPSDDAIDLTPAGTTLLRLQGRDRLRWILAIETSMATSALDSWCIDLDSVKHLARGKTWTFGADPIGPPVRASTFARWAALGALEHGVDDYGFESYDINRIGRELFDELARDDATSFRTLARAFLEDEREPILVPPPPEARDRAAEATLRHARMVAHEVRNALLPVQHSLKKVWAHSATTPELEEPRRRIDEGLARLHRFIDDSLRLAPLASEESAVFSVMEAIDEARRQCDPAPAGGILIEAHPASAAPRCRGHQGRFALAMLNLLRNSVQAGGSGVRIQISVDARAPRLVTISVRDDGPGVPDDQRATLFENGVSHRSGGTGHGLSLVRRVVEQELNGRIQLAPPTISTTGACFELELPAEEDER